MKRGAVLCAAFFLLACFAEDAPAHRANVFAFVDGDAVRVECSFSRSQKVRNGTLTVSDSETGAHLLQGRTDGEGVFRFRPPAGFLRTGHGLTIVLDAGEGHRDTWDVSPEELVSLSSASPEAGTSSGAVAPSGSPAVPAVSVPATPPPAMGAAELEALVGRVVEAKLLPVKQALVRQEERGPGLRDIIGGIGWILGLLGLAAYLKYRR